MNDINKPNNDPSYEIEMFFHCKKCAQSIPNGMSPREYMSLEVGWTKKGLQVWCKRHEINVINLDFQGQKVKAS